MAQRFIACDREQSFLMPPDVREWLPEDHFAWFVLEAVEAMDLDAFYTAYRADGRSRPAFDPAMMVALILYAYARGTRSSRAIERACIEDIAFRVIAAQNKPDHATIARFVERHQDALAGVFGSVLGLCAKAGLVGFARSLARELGSRNITVNVVAPGFVDTDMTRVLSDEQRQNIVGQVPLGRYAQAEEIASSVRFLASDEAAYITGAVIPVDGGLGMGH